MTRRTPAGLSRVASFPAVAIAIAAVVAGCSVSAGPTFPPVGSSPAPAGEVTSGARAQVAAALAVEGLQVEDAKTAYRPPEGALFASAPRAVIQVTLPDDPTHGYIVLYAFGTPQQARAAAEDQATYIASGPGKVQFTPGTSYSLRVLGNIAIFYTWSPDNAPDARTPAIALALSQVGDEIAIPS
jgi:hypothetical protein